MNYKKICEDLGFQRLPKNFVSPAALAEALKLPLRDSLTSNIASLKGISATLSNLIEALGAVDATFTPRRITPKLQDWQKERFYQVLGDLSRYFKLAAFKTRTVDKTKLFHSCARPSNV